MSFFQKTAIAALFFACLNVFSSQAMMNERRVWETIVLDGTIPFTEQVTRSGICYEVRDTFDLSGKKVDMPYDCKLSFVGGMLSNGSINGNGCLIGNSGGDIVFGRQLAISNVSNREVTLAWFDLTENLDASWIISGLVENPAVEVLNLAGRMVRMTCVDLNHSLTVRGSGATIVPVLKTENSYFGLFRCDDGMGRVAFQFSNFRVIGDEEVKCNRQIVGDRLFYFNNCRQVTFDQVCIGNIVGGYGSSVYGYGFNAGLISCYDVRNLRIEKCEFYNNKCFEWICNMPIVLHRKDIDIVFNDNFIYDSHEGASPVYFICNHLELRRNKVRNCLYTGSLFNVHGYYSTFTDNDIRECVYSSIFDTCEYGDLQKTSLGEIAYYSETVECSNNYCDCANGTLLVTWAREIVIKNNFLSGMSLCNAQGCGALGAKPDKAFILPTNEMVTITGNTCYCDNVDEEMTLSYYRSFVRLASAYYLGGKLLIEGNIFQCSKHIDDYPFSISNMTEIIVNNNTIQGCYLYDTNAVKYGVLMVGNTYSIYYPLDDIDVSNVKVNNNIVYDLEENTDLLVKVIEGNKLYSIKRQEVNNNKTVFRLEERHDI